MNLGTKLSLHTWPKRHFNAKSKKDLLVYKHFLNHNRWPQNPPFILEWPYLTVQDMIRTKLIETHLDKILENVDE